MPDTRPWVSELAARVARDGRAVLVTVAHATGSTPREAGTAMIVGTGDSFGTIGGGHLEFEAIALGRAALAAADTPSQPWLVRFPLAARLGQCCGGVATLAFAVVGSDARPWLDRAADGERRREPMVLVSRIGGSATAPAHLLVAGDDVAGSLGTPALAAAAVAAARARLGSAPAEGASLIPAGDGDATLLVHVIVPGDFTVLVFGNGHVGRALVQVLGALPARVRWIDERDSDFPASVPANAQVIATDVPEAELAEAPPGSCVIVTTHTHALDLALVTAALARDDWDYLGLIGSTSKRNQFEKRLRARAFSPETLARLVCPIGRSGGLAIRSKDPGAIAIAVVAEILALREAKARTTLEDASAASRRRPVDRVGS